MGYFSLLWGEMWGERSADRAKRNSRRADPLGRTRLRRRQVIVIGELEQLSATKGQETKVPNGQRWNTIGTDEVTVLTLM